MNCAMFFSAKSRSAFALLFTLLVAVACSTLANETAPAITLEATHSSCLRPPGFEQPGALAVISLANPTRKRIRFWQQTSESLPVVHFAWIQADVLSRDGRWKERTVSLDSFESPSKEIAIEPGGMITIYAYVQRAIIEQLNFGERIRLIIFDSKRKVGVPVELVSAKFNQCDQTSGH